MWGYTLSGGTLRPAADAFTLHLVGLKEESLAFPAALLESGALRLHEGVDTLAYYRLVGEMVSVPSVLSVLRVRKADAQDIVVPSFANVRYVTNRASASVPAAVMAQVRSSYAELHHS